MLTKTFPKVGQLWQTKTLVQDRYKDSFYIVCRIIPSNSVQMQNVQTGEKFWVSGIEWVNNWSLLQDVG